MATSRNSVQGRTGSTSGQYFVQVSRYDLVLAAIPLVLGFALLAGALLPIPLHFSTAAGAIIGGLFVADALYFNPPTEFSTGQS